jgi:hypothetical protein
LRKFLLAKNNTVPVAISALTDLLLDEKTLKLQGHYRLTTSALSQICSVLCPGFGQVLFDVAGLRRKKSGSIYRVSVVKAARDYNSMVSFRFRQFHKHELIIDRRSRTVEGIVGPEYQFYSNMEFFQRVHEFLAQCGRPVAFQAAVYSNRRLSLRYRIKDAAFTVTTKGSTREPFYGGWHFSNSEIGDCAVHMTSLLLRSWTSSAAIVPVKGVSKLVHRGKRSSFSRKLNSMFARLGESADFACDLEDRINHLKESPLGLGGHVEEHKRRLQVLLSRLAKGKLPQRLADKVVNHVLFRGSYKADSLRAEDNEDGGATYDELQSATRMTAFRARTVYDLYNALTICARDQRPERQELAEQLAYQILVGRFHLH